MSSSSFRRGAACVLLAATWAAVLLPACHAPPSPAGGAGRAESGPIPESQRVITAALRRFEVGGTLRAFADTVAIQAWIKPEDIYEITHFAGSSAVRLDVPGDSAYIITLPAEEGTVASWLWIRLHPGVDVDDVLRALAGRTGGEKIVVAEVACTLSAADAAALPEIAREQQRGRS